MKLEDMILVSVDDHIVEPADMFDQHVTAAQKSLVPHVVHTDGADHWVYEGRKLPNPGLNAVAGRVPEEFGCEPACYEHMRLGAYNVHARVQDMNANGLLGSLNFPTFPGFSGDLFLSAKDKNGALVAVQAYNDWHIDEWCGAYPGRFIPTAITPMWDVNLIVEEIKRVSKKGCHSISFTDNPSKKGLPGLHTDYWEPMWKVCADLDVVICNHIGTGNVPQHPSMESPIDAWIIGMPISVSLSAADWIHLKALQRYPNLKIALSEGGIGWIPYLLERADFTHQQHGAWTHADFGGKKPSEIFREHFITCFIDDKFGIANRHEIGIETITYECDYPHSDSLWPKSAEWLIESFEGIPDDEIDLMTHKNAMKAFHYDPFAILGRENCTVGALREQARDVDISLKAYGAHGGASPLEQGVKRVVTSGDVVKMFPHAIEEKEPA